MHELNLVCWSTGRSRPKRNFRSVHPHRSFSCCCCSRAIECELLGFVREPNPTGLFLLLTNAQVCYGGIGR